MGESAGGAAGSSLESQRKGALETGSGGLAQDEPPPPIAPLAARFSWGPYSLGDAACRGEKKIGKGKAWDCSQEGERTEPCAN